MSLLVVIHMLMQSAGADDENENDYNPGDAAADGDLMVMMTMTLWKLVLPQCCDYKLQRHLKKMMMHADDDDANDGSLIMAAG